MSKPSRYSICYDEIVRPNHGTHSHPSGSLKYRYIKRNPDNNDSPPKFVEKYLELNTYLGYTDGNFDTNLDTLHLNARNRSWYAYASKHAEHFPCISPSNKRVLRAWLLKRGLKIAVDKAKKDDFEMREINLDLILNLHGESLVLNRFTDLIYASTSFRYIDDTTLYALCLNHAGEFKPSKIDLEPHYRSQFNSGPLAMGGLELTEDQEGIHVIGTLSGQKIKISDNIVNKDGVLTYEVHNGFFDREGWLADFLDDIPIIGLLVPVVHGLAGNEPFAKVAAINSISATIVAGAVALGGIFGGPVGGIVVSGMMDPISIIVKNKVAQAEIDDPVLIKQFDLMMVEDAAIDVIQSMALSALPFGFGKWAKAMGGEITHLTKGLVPKMFSKTTAYTIDNVGEQLVNGVVDNMQKRLPAEATASFSTYAKSQWEQISKTR